MTVEEKQRMFVFVLKKEGKDDDRLEPKNINPGKFDDDVCPLTEMSEARLLVSKLLR
jgi:hypothetical protein